MKYLKENKDVLLCYLYIFLSNILLFVFNNFYFRSVENKEMFLLFFVVIIDYIIIRKYKIKSKFYLDLLINFIVSIILMFLAKDNLSYSYAVFSISFANNIMFIKSRISDKFLLRSLQYLMMLLYSIFVLFLDFIIFYFI